jgi:methylglutaconyl-CoA hydratase
LEDPGLPPVTQYVGGIYRSPPALRQDEYPGKDYGGNSVIPQYRKDPGPMMGPGEEEDLQQYGVSLAPDHTAGYTFREDLATTNADHVKKPWESNLLQQLGPESTAQCATAEAWNNEDVLLEIRDGIAYCTLNRAATNNAINNGISDGLHDAGRILRSRRDIRIAVLTGYGRMFCAGGSPTGQGNAGHANAEDDEAAENPSGKSIAGKANSIVGSDAAADQLARDMLQWATLPQFTICCMNGSAMGMGVGLMCMCDAVVSVKTAHVTLSEVKLGIVPATVSPHVIRTIGVAHAKQLFCTAENINMQKALEFGLVQRVVSDISEFPTVIKEIASKIQSLAPGALAITKQTALHCANQPMSEKMLEYLATEYANVRKGEECETGMKSILSKKRPAWVEKKIIVKEGV